MTFRLMSHGTIWSLYRKKSVGQVAKGCRIAKEFRELGIRPHGVVHVDSAGGVTDWDKDPKGNTRRIVATFREAAKVATDHGERPIAAGPNEPVRCYGCPPRYLTTASVRQRTWSSW